MEFKNTTFNHTVISTTLMNNYTSDSGNLNVTNATTFSNFTSSNGTEPDIFNLDFNFYEQYANRLSNTNFYTLELVIYGYLFVPAAVIVLAINSLMLVVFFKGKFFNPANVLISAIAITDILTCVTPAPLFFYFYSLENALEFTPYDLCMLFDLLCRKIPRTFHTVSVWITVGLAVQRFIVVSFPLKAKIFCNMKFSVVWICMAYLLACLLHAIVFVYEDYLPVPVSSTTSDKTMQGCVTLPRNYFMESRELIINTYNTLNGVFVHLLPTVLLVILDILLVIKLRKAEKWRRETSDRKDATNNAFIMNIIIIWIVAAFLIVETPIAVGYLFQVTYTSIVAPPYGAPMENLTKAVTIMNYLIVLTSISNTVVYCCLSKRFRDQLKELLNCGNCLKKKTGK